jgi:hypothetical protein
MIVMRACAMAVRFRESGCENAFHSHVVIAMRGLVPRIHVFVAAGEGVDGRYNAGHDDDAT